MKFSLVWLKQYLETEATAQEIAAKLNALGIEVEALEDPAERLAGFRVARVLTGAPHPKADKVQVQTVHAGRGEPQMIGAVDRRAGKAGSVGDHAALCHAEPRSASLANNVGRPASESRSTGHQTPSVRSSASAQRSRMLSAKWVKT